MMKKVLESMKWFYEEIMLTCMWTLVYSLILEDEDVFFPFMLIDSKNLYGCVIAIMITIIATETIGIIIKRVSKTIKEIKG